jgi:hypothetical protein
VLGGAEHLHFSTQYIYIAQLAQWRCGWPGFDSRQGREILFLSAAYRPALGPTQPPIQWESREGFCRNKGADACSQALTSIWYRGHEWSSITFMEQVALQLLTHRDNLSSVWISCSRGSQCDYETVLRLLQTQHSQRWLGRVLSSGTQRHIVPWRSTDVSGEHIAPYSGSNKSSKIPASKLIVSITGIWFLIRLTRSWRWKRYAPPKRRLTFNILHGVVSQNTVVVFKDLDSAQFVTSCCVFLTRSARLVLIRFKPLAWKAQIIFFRIFN